MRLHLGPSNINQTGGKTMTNLVERIEEALDGVTEAFYLSGEANPEIERRIDCNRATLAEIKGEKE